MTDVVVTTAAGGEAALKEQMVAAFGSRLRGELLRPGGSAYEAARSVWNGMGRQAAGADRSICIQPH